MAPKLQSWAEEVNANSIVKISTHSAPGEGPAVLPKDRMLLELERSLGTLGTVWAGWGKEKCRACRFWVKSTASRLIESHLLEDTSLAVISFLFRFVLYRENYQGGK